MIEVTCPYGPPHVHKVPNDWKLGGSDGCDIRADPRWKPSTYTYFDHRIQPIHITQVPICDDEAIDYFTQVAGFGPDFNPIWVQVRRPDGLVESIPVEYEKATDTAWSKEE